MQMFFANVNLMANTVTLRFFAAFHQTEPCILLLLLAGATHAVKYKYKTVKAWKCMESQICVDCTYKQKWSFY